MEGEERLVVFSEVADRRLSDCSPLKETVTRAILERHELKVHTIHFVKPYRLAKTSSGKIQRQRCKSDFLSGALEAIG